MSCCENRFNVVVSIEVDCDKACHLYGIVEDAACGFLNLCFVTQLRLRYIFFY